MIVGVITGTYSSVFIAAAIVTFWPQGSGRKAVVAPTAPTPQPGRTPQTTRARAKKAKAS